MGSQVVNDHALRRRLGTVSVNLKVKQLKGEPLGLVWKLKQNWKKEELKRKEGSERKITTKNHELV